MAIGNVTVVMPVKNGMPYIGEAIASVLAHGPSVAAVLVVDDGSTDGTLDMLAACADPRVTLLRNPGRGVSSARNSGVQQADSEWIMFLDADDRLAPGAVDCLLSHARPESVAIYGDYDRIDACGRRLGLRHLVRSRRRKPSGDVLDTVVTVNFIAVGCVLVRREALLRVGGMDQSLHLCEDWLLWCRLAAIGPIDHVPGLHVFDYRIHGASTMHRRARAFADMAPVIDRIFDDPLVRGRLDPQVIPQRKAMAEHNLRFYVAIEAVRLRAWHVAAGELFVSALRSPASIPRMTVRLAASMAGM